VFEFPEILLRVSGNIVFADTPSMEKTMTAAARVRKRVWNAIYATANGVDTALATIGGLPLSHLAKQNEKRAMLNPEYARIEGLRSEAGTKVKTMFSREKGLDMDAWDTQDAIRDEVSRHPWWEDAARALTQRSFTRGLSAVRHAFQRVSRGWDDRALWSLDDHLCSTLSAQLLAHAKTAHGWPCSEQYPTYEDWIVAVTKAGTALGEYHKIYESDLNEEARIRDEASAALRWVADNLGGLWD
jgi:hypothetical protein